MGGGDLSPLEALGLYVRPNGEAMSRDPVIARFPCGRPVESLLTDSRGRTYVLFGRRALRHIHPRPHRLSRAHALEAILPCTVVAGVICLVSFALNV